MRASAATAAKVAIATATKTILQVLAPADRSISIHEVSMSFDGADATAVPIQVELVTQTDAGSGGTGVTPNKLDRPDGGTIETSALSGPTSEPSLGDILKTWFIHPNGGALLYVVPEPEKFRLADGQRLALRVVDPPAAVNAVGSIEFNE